MCSERGFHKFRLRPEEVSGWDSVSLPASICRTHTRALTCHPQGLSRTGVARLRRTVRRRSRADPTGPTLEFFSFVQGTCASNAIQVNIGQPYDEFHWLMMEET